jgi:hypothetical protein
VSDGDPSGLCATQGAARYLQAAQQRPPHSGPLIEITGVDVAPVDEDGLADVEIHLRSRATPVMQGWTEDVSVVVKDTNGETLRETSFTASLDTTPHTWRLSLEGGSYTAVATLDAVEGELTARKSFKVPIANENKKRRISPIPSPRLSPGGPLLL